MFFNVNFEDISDSESSNLNKEKRYIAYQDFDLIPKKNPDGTPVLTKEGRPVYSDYDDFILEVIKTTKPTGDYMYDKMVLLEYYETYFGIHNHLTHPGSLALVSYNEPEEYRKNGLYDGYLRTFLYRDIHKKLGLSFDDYLNRPRFEIEAINKMVAEIDKQKMKSHEDAMKEMEKGKPSSKDKIPIVNPDVLGI